VFQQSAREEEVVRKQLIGIICLGGLSVIGLVFWESPVQAAGGKKTVEIVLSPEGLPMLSPENVEINAGDSITWAPQDAGIHHRLLENGTNKEITKTFNETVLETATQEFKTSGVVKYHCFYHPTTMQGTINVK
jgi:plastocyanin